jgi:hypothetical protein
MWIPSTVSTAMIDDGNDEFNMYADVASDQTIESEFSGYWAEKVANR